MLGPLLVVTLLFPNILLKLLPALGHKVGLLKTEQFFRELLPKLLADRRKNPEVKRDFLQLLLETQDLSDAKLSNDDALIASENDSGADVSDKQGWKANKDALTDDEIVAQCFIFLVAGYHTTAMTLTFAVYSLAKNPEIQERCYQELRDVLEVSYETVHGQMPYLESVVLETLRMYPPASRLDRLCSEDYESSGLRIPAGTAINIAVHSIHHSPEYYPDPEKFDPQRFTAEDRNKRDPCTFLPFGVGPRNCVGMRFALMEIKLTLASILLKFKFVTCPRTQETLTLKGFGLIRPTEPIWLRVEKR